MPERKDLHGIPREEWETRFRAHVMRRLDAPADDTYLADAELESWPPVDDYPIEGEPNDWEVNTPEEAADESLSNWSE